MNSNCAVRSADDNGDDTYDHPIAQSMPIPIGPLGARGQTFGAPKYQPKTSLSDRPGILVPELRTGTDTAAASIRRASYVDRDPGALDFIDDHDEDEDEEDSGDSESGNRARQRALKILKARNEMPAAGKFLTLVRRFS